MTVYGSKFSLPEDRVMCGGYDNYGILVMALGPVGVDPISAFRGPVTACKLVGLHPTSNMLIKEHQYECHCLWNSCEYIGIVLQFYGKRYLKICHVKLLLHL